MDLQIYSYGDGSWIDQGRTLTKGTAWEMKITTPFLFLSEYDGDDGATSSLYSAGDTGGGDSEPPSTHSTADLIAPSSPRALLGTSTEIGLVIRTRSQKAADGQVQELTSVETVPVSSLDKS